MCIRDSKEAMHNVKKSFKRLLAVSLCASCVLSNGMLSLAEGAAVSYTHLSYRDFQAEYSIPASAKTGEGLAELKKALLEIVRREQIYVCLLYTSYRKRRCDREVL